MSKIAMSENAFKSLFISYNTISFTLGLNEFGIVAFEQTLPIFQEMLF